jgi:hypothetical protein
VQVGDLGGSFSLVAFGGNVSSYKSYALGCLNTKEDKPVEAMLPWPSGRALVRDEFSHSFKDMARDYGYVKTGGCGNLLICRNHPLDYYKIIGGCIDEDISNKSPNSRVNIR